jgi:hypothetical protein
MQACTPEHSNPVNPMVGREMQQAPDAFGGAIRRGGVKPRGRHMSGAWQRQAEAGSGLREDALKVSTAEGQTRRNWARDGWQHPPCGTRCAFDCGRREMWRAPDDFGRMAARLQDMVDVPTPTQGQGVDLQERPTTWNPADAEVQRIF